MIDFGDLLCKKMGDLRLNTTDVALKSGIAYSSIKNYQEGISVPRKPQYDKLNAIFHFGMSYEQVRGMR